MLGSSEIHTSQRQDYHHHQHSTTTFFIIIVIIIIINVIIITIIIIIIIIALVSPNPIGKTLGIKFRAEFPVKCKNSDVLKELSSGVVAYDSSNCTKNPFVSNGSLIVSRLLKL